MRLTSLYRIFKPKRGKEIPFLILISFLFAFAASRFITYVLPETALLVRGTHVHHFAWGFILVAITGYFLLTQPRSTKTRLKTSLIYGLSLGIAFDEFAMWIQLEDSYYDRSTYDAIVVITLILANIIYFSDFWTKWGHRLKSLIKKIFS